MLKELKIKRAINGDEKAFVELIEERKEKLYKIAYSYMKNEQDALDVVSEAVYKSYVSIKTLKKAKYFDTWLTRITINISIDMINKNKKVTLMDEDSFKEEKSEKLNLEEKLDVHNAIDNLDDKYKNIIKLKYFDDLTINEISNKTNMPQGTIKTNLSRGLKQLKVLMKEGN